MNLPARPHAQHDPDPASPAINRADGIARLMGDAGLFARVLARFRKDYRHAGTRIREALAVSDRELAQRLAHTLKGASGMIEAVPLREAAQALEQALRRGEEQLAPRLTRLEHALDRVLRELDAAEDFAPPVRQLAQHESHGNGHGKLVARLRTLLEDGNGDAVDLVREAAAGLTSELGEERYRRITAAVELFDFETALASISA
jgi:HPt (histidine-containing phosphotransfer) domain-containing protein